MKNQNASDKPANRPEKESNCCFELVTSYSYTKLTVIDVINKEGPVIMRRCSDIADTFDRKVESSFFVSARSIRAKFTTT